MEQKCGEEENTLVRHSPLHHISSSGPFLPSFFSPEEEGRRSGNEWMDKGGCPSPFYHVRLLVSFSFKVSWSCIGTITNKKKSHLPHPTYTRAYGLRTNIYITKIILISQYETLQVFFEIKNTDFKNQHFHLKGIKMFLSFLDAKKVLWM